MISAIHGGRAVGRRAALAVFVTTCAIWAAVLLLEWMTRGVSSHDELGPYDIVGLVVVTLLLAFPATGLVIALRRPATPIGWLLPAIGAGWGLLLVTSGYADYGLLAHPGSLPAPDVVAAVGGAAWAIPVGRTRIAADGRPPALPSPLRRGPHPRGLQRAAARAGGHRDRERRGAERSSARRSSRRTPRSGSVPTRRTHESREDVRRGERAAAVWGAWAVFAVTSALWVVAIVTAWLTRDLENPESLGSGGADLVRAIGVAVVLLAFPIAGIVIATRQPANLIGWILLAIGAGWALLAGATGYADYGIRLHPGSLPGGRRRSRAHADASGRRRSGSRGRSCCCSSRTAACPVRAGGGSRTSAPRARRRARSTALLDPGLLRRQRLSEHAEPDGRREPRRGDRRRARLRGRRSGGHDGRVGREPRRAVPPRRPGRARAGEVAAPRRPGLLGVDLSRRPLYRRRPPRRRPASRRGGSLHRRRCSC